MSDADAKPYDPTLPPPLNTMTLEELDAFSDYYDKEFVADECEPLTPEMRRLDEASKRKLPDPPRVNRTIRIALRPELVERT